MIKCKFQTPAPPPPTRPPGRAATSAPARFAGAPQRRSCSPRSVQRFLASMLAYGVMAVGTCRPAVAARWRVTLARLDRAGYFVKLNRAKVIRWSRRGELTLRLPGGHTRTLAAADVLNLKAIAPARGAGPFHRRRGGWKLVLRNGNVLVGRPVRAPAGDVAIDVYGPGTVRVPIKIVAGLGRRPSTFIPVRAADHDTLYLSNGDKLPGAFVALGGSSLEWSSSLGQTRITLTRIDRFVLGGPVGKIVVSGGGEQLRLIGANRLDTRWIQWRSGTIRFPGPAGDILKCPAANLRGVCVYGGRVRWLADLAPASYRQVSYFNEHWPLGINRNVLARPLEVNRRRYTHGLGMHVRTTLTYALNGIYTKFVFIPAMDDSAHPFGRARLLVAADKKIIYRSAILAPGRAVKPVVLSVRGVHTLVLQARGVGRYGVRGRVDWLNAALLR